MLARVAVGLIVSVGIVAAQPQAPGFNLPDTVRPISYSLDLSIRPEQPTFEGTVRIDVEFRASTTVFWLNARNLTLHAAEIEMAGVALPLRIVAGDAETVGFVLPGPVPAGSARIVIRYSGKLDKDANDGPFRRLLGNDWYAFTTFTPIEARRAFPCFDEPRFKTPWQLTLHVKQRDVALGNAPEESKVDEPDGMKKVVFATTLPLPSEVVAFAVGPFDVVDAGRAGKKQIPVRIITPHGRSADAEAAKSATPEILNRLEDYTGIAYPWAKLDHLALVKGAFGAVENPGLITYQEGILLASPARDTPERRHQMQSTMAHELAHQWFGNLVTQSSWTDVWLSEGFATWLSTKVMDREYALFERGLSGNLRLHAMDADRKSRGWAVRRPIGSREEAKTVYNTLVYSKAAAVLDTLEAWLGEEPFQRGLQKYLAGHSLNAATTDDLASALQSESGVEVGPVLHSLLDHPGIPAVSFKVDCQQAVVDSGDWIVPVCLHWNDGGRQCSVVGPGKTSTPINATSCLTWLWTNSSGRGYYRTLLTAENLNAILAGGYFQLDSAERRTLISDVGAAMYSGQLPAAVGMKILAAAARDPEARVAIESLRIAAGLGEVVRAAKRPEYAMWLEQTYGVSTPVSGQAESVVEFLNARRVKKGR